MNIKSSRSNNNQVNFIYKNRTIFPNVCMLCIIFTLLRYDNATYPRLVWNLLCSPSWLLCLDNPPALASQVWRLQSITPSSSVTYYFLLLLFVLFFSPSFIRCVFEYWNKILGFVSLTLCTLSLKHFDSSPMLNGWLL